MSGDNMNCKKNLHWLNAYLDHTLPWLESQEVESHLTLCPGCQHEYRRLLRLRQVMRSLNRQEPPADLGLHLAIAISKEKHGYAWQRFRMRLDDLLRPILLPAFSGVLLTFLLFLVPMNSFFPDSKLSASGRDIPVGIFTEPRLDPAAIRQILEVSNLKSVEKPFTVETRVGVDGRVINYKLIDGPRDQETVRKIDQFLFFQVIFDPATVFGRPTTGTFIWSFNKIDVVG
jgi:hypothetical protein